jgi:hypothetical protein
MFVHGSPVLEWRGRSHPIRFPSMPLAYGTRLSNGARLETIATVYGDRTLGFFNPGHCYYFNDERECKFCSLGPARKSISDHAMKLVHSLASEATMIAIRAEPKRIKRVLLNGGNVRNYDKGFRAHVDMLNALSNALGELGRQDIDRHLISMPPVDFDLFFELAKTVDTLAMSLEIADPDLFSRVCPGKAQDYGRARFMESYRVAVDALGFGNVYVGLVLGLEPYGRVIDLLTQFAEMGVVPALAVFHPGRGSKFEYHPRPMAEDIMRVAEAVSHIFSKYSFRPFIKGSGRNSIDSECANWLPNYPDEAAKLSRHL